MTTVLRARVQNGRITVDEPTDLPDGTVLELAPGIEVDDIGDEDRAKLHAAIARGLEQSRRGELRPVADALAAIRNAK